MGCHSPDLGDESDTPRGKDLRCRGNPNIQKEHLDSTVPLTRQPGCSFLVEEAKAPIRARTRTSVIFPLRNNISSNYHLSYTLCTPCQTAELFISNFAESFVLSGISLNIIVPGPIKHPEPTNTPGIMPV